MKRAVILLVVVLCVQSVVQAQIRRTRRAGNEQSKSEVNYAQPKEYQIADIKVQGVDFLDKNALISISGLRVGDRVKIPGDDLSMAIRKLWKHGVVGEVEIYLEKTEGDQAYLIIQLKERPRLTKYSFTGVNKTQAGELSDKIDLIKGKILTDADIKNIELQVRGFFVNKGFLDTEVDIVKRADTIVSNGVQLEIDVNRKAKVRIDRIDIVGAEQIEAARVKSKMKKTKEKARFTILNDIAQKLVSARGKDWKNFFTKQKKVDGKDMKRYLNQHVKLNIFKSSKYIKKDFEEDKKLIVDFYNSKGYRDAEVTFDTITNRHDGLIDIKIGVEEGKKYYFRNILWSGNYIYSDETLGRVLGIQKGDVYDMERMNKRLQSPLEGTDISGLYLDDGYLFFNIEPVEVAIEDDSIDIELRIFEGDQATINKIVISGNDRTNDHVILREIRTLPGDKFRRSDLIRTQQQLSQLGYFDAEQINIRPVPNPVDGTVDMYYDLVERPSDQVELSGGWGGVFGFVGTLGLTFNNFSIRNIPHFDKWRPLPVGDGQRLSIRAQANGRQFQSYTFQFVEPWLGGRKPNSFSVNLNSTVQRNINAFTNQSLGTLKLHSISIGLGKRLEWPDNYFTLNTTLGYTIYQLDNWVFADRSLGFSDGDAHTMLLGFTLARNSVNNPMYPTSGSLISLNATFTPPHSLWRDLDYENAEPAQRYEFVEYHKWMFDAKYYIPLAGKLVMEAKAHFGVIGSYNPKVGVGPFERYTMGGAGLAGQNFLLGTDIVSLRGYDDNRITPPYGVVDRVDEIEGGIIFNKFAAELRYPLTTGQAATIYVYGFAEGGNNWNAYQDFNPFDLYRSAGIGARVFMPAFGLIGVNYGYGFDNLPGTNTPSGGQFQFAIGQQIR